MLGDRLKLARKKAGYTLRGLSVALDGEVSAQAIGKYERSEMKPRPGMLPRLAKTLDVPITFFLSERVEKLEGIEFRKLSNTTAKDRARVEAEVIEYLQRYLNIEDVLDIDGSAWNVPECGNRWLYHEEEGEDLANCLRHEWNLGCDPIPNMTSLLEDQGLKVIMLPLPNRVSGLMASVHRASHHRTVPVIVVNLNSTLERRRLTLAHELAHQLIHPDSKVDHEKASNIFAGALLVPETHLVRRSGKHRNALGYREIIQSKRLYRVSAVAFLMRLRQLEIIAKSTLTRALSTYARTWRSREPEPIEVKGEEGMHEVPLRFERLCYWALAEQFISPVKACELLQCSLSEAVKGLKGPKALNAVCSE